MVVQYGGLCGEEPAPCVGIEAHSKVMRTQQLSLSDDYTLMKTYLQILGLFILLLACFALK